MRLVILPHAGGSAHAYAPLARALEARRIEAVVHELPAHGRRAREASVTDIAGALADLFSHLPIPQGRPWALFGHSMGALLGHAFIHALQRQGRALPRALFASGTMAPAARRRIAVSHLPKEEFWREISAYGGVPEEILAVPDFRDYFETIIRPDFAVIESYLTSVPRPIPVPVVAFYGSDEMSQADAATWEWETTRSLATHGYPGHHFFLFDHADAIAGEVAEALAVQPRCELRHA